MKTPDFAAITRVLFSNFLILTCNQKLFELTVIMFFFTEKGYQVKANDYEYLNLLKPCNSKFTGRSYFKSLRSTKLFLGKSF